MANVELSTMDVFVVRKTGANIKRILSQACVLERWDVCATAKGYRACQQMLSVTRSGPKVKQHLHGFA